MRKTTILAVWMDTTIPPLCSCPCNAGLAEGYLTRNTVHEYWKEFFGDDLCKDDHEDTDKPKFCEYMRRHMDENEEWLRRKIKGEADVDPFWHMVRLFYIQVTRKTCSGGCSLLFQIDGLTEGWLRMTKQQLNTTTVGDFDLKYGMRFMNYIADVWDYVEKFKMLHPEETVSEV